jgi:hypothetical protein
MPSWSQIELVQPHPSALAVATSTVLDGEGLLPKEFTDQRNDAMREVVKALLLMNGGGAVALLAFLQAIWKPETIVLVRLVLFGMGFLISGVVLAGLVHLFRVHTSNATQRFYKPGATELDRQVEYGKAKNYQLAYFVCAYGSLIVFAIGGIFILLGAGYVRIMTHES